MRVCEDSGLPLPEQAQTRDGITVANTFDGSLNQDIADAIDGVASALRLSNHLESCHLCTIGPATLHLKGPDYNLQIDLNGQSVRREPRKTIATALARHALDIVRLRNSHASGKRTIAPWDCVMSLDLAKIIAMSGDSFDHIYTLMTIHDMDQATWSPNGQDTLLLGIDKFAWMPKGKINREIAISKLDIPGKAILSRYYSNYDLTILQALDDDQINMVGQGEGLAELLERPYLSAFPLALKKPKIDKKKTHYEILRSNRGAGVRLAPIPDAILESAEELAFEIATSNDLNPKAFAVTQPEYLFEDDVHNLLRQEAGGNDAEATPTLAQILRQAYEAAPKGNDPWEAVAKAAVEAADSTLTAPHARTSQDWGNTPVEYLPLSTLPKNALLSEGFRKAFELHRLTRTQMNRIPNLGPKSIQEIEAVINNLMAA